MGTTPAKAAAEEFSFSSWLGKGSRPARYVTLYAANELQAEIEAIEAELRAREAAAPKGTMGGAAGTGTLEKRVADLQAQIADTAAVFKVQAITPAKNDDISRRHPMPDDGTDEDRGTVILTRWQEQVAAQIVAFGPTREGLAPATFTVEQVRQLREQVGEVEYAKLLDKCQECMSEVSASTPTWRGSSGRNRS